MTTENEGTSRSSSQRPDANGVTPEDLQRNKVLSFIGGLVTAIAMLVIGPRLANGIRSMGSALSSSRVRRWRRAEEDFDRMVQSELRRATGQSGTGRNHDRESTRH